MSQNRIFHIEPLNETWIEQVRFWRNQNFVRQQMEYNAVISEKAQHLWFPRLQNDPSQRYFIFFSGSIPVGIIHLSKLDLEKKEAEVGLFIGDANFIGTGISLEASLFILDLAFKQLKLNRLFAKVKMPRPLIQNALQELTQSGLLFLKPDGAMQFRDAYTAKAISQLNQLVD